jgi:hypothetical protein
MGKKTKFKTVNVINILQELKLFYAESGKNVTTGWVNVNCPFCHDPSWHLGINLTSNRCSCWKCGKSISFWGYLKEVFEFSNAELWEIFNRHELLSYDEARIAKFSPTGGLSGAEDGNCISKVTLPSKALTGPLKIHSEYLKSRNFSPKQLAAYFRLKFTGAFSSYMKKDKTKIDFSYRILIPVFMHGKLVNFTGRDVTGASGAVRYKNCPNEEAIVSTRDCLYNYDNVEHTALIVEGPTDVWRMNGYGCLATMGIKITKQQILHFQNLNLKKAVVLFDKGAENEQSKLVDTLSLFIPEVFEIKNLFDDFDDPGSLNKKQVKEIRRLVFT